MSRNSRDLEKLSSVVLCVSVLPIGEILLFQQDFRSRLRSAGPLPYGRGSVGVPWPARRCLLPAAGCRLWLRLAALCLCGEATFHCTTERH